MNSFTLLCFAFTLTIMFPFYVPGLTNEVADAKPPLYLYNTLTRSKERFAPIRKDFVRMYNCGPTVYDYAHIGNLRSYVFADTLRRVFTYNGFKVMQVVNITDVGHLTSDADHGDDKMTVGLLREGLPLTLEGMKALADKYTEAWLLDLEALNVKRPSVLPRASEHIQADIALIEALMQKEYAYRTGDGVYFDTGRFEDYGKLGDIDIKGLREGARIEKREEKRNPTDFALWKRNDALGWDSPWGRGFPGWHVECSAMAMQYLGKELDVHTGGVDHIGTHHNNEIAQSEAATGKQFARYWLHNAHILIEGVKLSKSLKNTIQLRQIVEHGYHPLAYRYWLLTGHYRTTMNFSFTALEAAQTALRRLQRHFAEELLDVATGALSESYATRFHLAVNDDLDTPRALSILWELIKDTEVSGPEKRTTLLNFDKVLGLGLVHLVKSDAGRVSLAVAPTPLGELADEVRTLVEEREQARARKDWSSADVLRERIMSAGYAVEDTATGPRVTKV